MPVPGQGGVSQTARLLLGAPSYAVGWQEPLYLSNPAAGSEWTYTVSGRFYERLLSVRYTLVTSAVVANRFPRLALADANGTHVLSVPVAGTVVAGTTLFIHGMLGAPAFGSGTTGNSQGFIPDMLIPPGWTWHVNTSGLDAGDTETGIVLIVQRFPSDTASIEAGA